MHRWTLLLALAACLPEVDSDLSRVDEPRILAIAADPPEVAPGAVASFTALYADASGEVAAAPLEWAFCTARRPLAELGPVSGECLSKKGDALAAAGQGRTITAAVPADACRLFGPDPPPTEPGQPAGRAVDPDLTGGYYAPLRVVPPEGLEALGLLRVRVTCGLAGATQAQAAEFRQHRKPNAAPAIAEITGDGAAIAKDASLVVAPGETVALAVRWAACPAEASCGDGACSLDETAADCPADCEDSPGCGGAETYLKFDPQALALTTAREAMSVAWFATAGAYAQARTGRAADDLEVTSDNEWRAPDEPGAASLWLVLRDDRGASTWRRLDVEVTP